MRYGFILVALIFLVSCGDSKENKNTGSGGTSHFEVEPEEENVVYEEADARLSADQIINLTSEVWRSNWLVQGRLLEYFSKNSEDSEDSKNRSQSAPMSLELSQKVWYLLDRLGVDVVCSEDVTQDSCSDSIENLVEATVLDSFPQNTSIISIGSIEIINRRVEDGEDGEDVFFDYVIGVEDKLHVVTGPDVSVDNWVTIVRDVIMSPDRLKAIFARERISSDRVLGLESYFDTRILKHDNIDDIEFKSALETLWHVSKLDEELRRPGKYFSHAVSRERSLGVKAFQNIVIGNRNEDIHENEGKLTVEIDWDQTPGEMYLHLIKQPNLSVHNSFTPFQGMYLQEVGMREEASQNYKALSLASLETLKLQKNVNKLYLELPDLMGISGIQCGLYGKRSRLLRFIPIFEPGLSLEECEHALLEVKEIVQSFIQEEDIDKIRPPDSCGRDLVTLGCSLFYFMASEAREDKKVVIIRNEKLKPNGLNMEEDVVFISYEG